MGFRELFKTLIIKGLSDLWNGISHAKSISLPQVNFPACLPDLGVRRVFPHPRSVHSLPCKGSKASGQRLQI